MARIALYYPWIYLKSGVERTLLEVYRRSRHDITIYTSHYDREATYEDLKECRIRELGQVSVRRTYVEAARAALRMARLRFRPADHDALVIACDGLGPLMAFRNADLPLMNLCFTPLRAVYDTEYRKRLLDQGGPRGPKVLAERAFRIVDRRAWRHFDSVLCNSRTTRDRVVSGGLRRQDETVVEIGRAHV